MLSLATHTLCNKNDSNWAHSENVPDHESEKSPVDVADEEEEAEEGADEQHHCRLLGKHKSWKEGIKAPVSSLVSVF